MDLEKQEDSVPLTASYAKDLLHRAMSTIATKSCELTAAVERVWNGMDLGVESWTLEVFH